MKSRDSRKRSELLAALNDEFRELSTVTILFHQAIADRLGMHLTDHKCAGILLRAGPITAGELGRHTGLTTGTITAVIDRLEKAGFVRRAEDPRDRRRVLIEPLRERIEEKIGPLFESMARAMTELCEQYSTQELATIRDFTARAHQGAYEEIRKLREGSEPAKGRRTTTKK